MSTTPKIEVIEEFKSPQGVRGRLGRMLPGESESPLAAALVYCKARGCGAWTGRSACAKPATHVALGGAFLPFMLYRARFTEGGPSLAVLCDRHVDDPTCSMPPAILREQEHEFRSLLRLRGALAMEAAARVVVMLPLDDNVLARIEEQLGAGWVVR